MSSSNTFKALLTVAVVASIAWKIAGASEPQSDWTNGLVEFFERNHFNVVTTDQLPIIQAKTSSCRLQIAKVAADGSNQDVVRHLATDTDRLFFVFRGGVYTQQPIFWTQIDYLWSKPLRELGLIKQTTPVIAVIANSSCKAEQLPWAELHEIY